MPTDQETLDKYLTDAQRVTGLPEWDVPLGKYRLGYVGAGVWLRETQESGSKLWTCADGGMPSQHEALCLWRDHLRTYLHANTHRFEECTGPDSAAVTVWVGPAATYQRFHADTIDAALIAAVVWVDKTKGE